MLSPQYSIRSNARLLFDSPQNIDFHIKTGDYFSFLATLVGFLEEALGAHETCPERAIARDLRSDLRYVQAHYRIVPRQPGDAQAMLPSGNLIGQSLDPQ